MELVFRFGGGICWPDDDDDESMWFSSHSGSSEVGLLLS